MRELEIIKMCLENNYERQQERMVRDITFLLKLLNKEMGRAEKYWKAANQAELRVQELEEELELTSERYTGDEQTDEQKSVGTERGGEEGLHSTIQAKRRRRITCP